MTQFDHLALPDDDAVLPSVRGVLVIDDDAALLELLVLGLREMGLEAQGVSTSAEAMSVLNAAEPMCVVVDLNMPDVQGLDLVRSVLTMKQHALIVLSAYLDIATTVQAMRLGAHDVLEKPISIQGLYAAVMGAQEQVETDLPGLELGLTRRERQVAGLLVKGMTAKQIAQDLDLSPRTIEFFRSNLMRKTRSSNVAGLASNLTRLGFS